MNQSLFEQFKRTQRAVETATPQQAGAVRVQLCFDAVGSYIQLLNQRGEVIEPGYQAYSGALRNLLRAIQQLRERNGFIIDWENPTAQLYLHQYDYLLDYLRQCPDVIDERGKPVTFTDQQGELRLQIRPETAADDVPEDDAAERNVPEDDVPERSVPGKNRLDASLKLMVDGQYESDFLLLNERYALSEGRVLGVAQGWAGV